MLIAFSQVSAQGFYLPNLSPTEEYKIMPLGNSITYGIGSSDLASYRRALFEKLINAGYGTDFVGSLETGNGAIFDNDHEGHPGWHADQPNSTIRSIVDSLNGFLRKSPPDIILLHIGTNDLGEGQDPPGLTNEVERILNLIDDYEYNYSREVTVFLAQIINVRSPFSERGIRTTAYNDSLQALAARRLKSGDNLILVDQESALFNSPSDYADDIHPNDAGYLKMADVWFEALDNYFRNSNNQIFITKQPKDFGSVEGERVTFSVEASSFSPIQYQWFKNNIPISGATSPVLTIQSVKAQDDGAEIYVRLYNGSNQLFSSSAKLYVTADSLRVTNSLQVLYNFTEGDGSVINDFSNTGNELNLYISELDKVEWNYEGLKINQSTLIPSNHSAISLIDSIKSTNEISVETWVLPENLTQSGPARIVTISSDASNRNVTLGQDADDIEVRLRTTETSEQGSPSLITDANFLTKNFVHLVYTREKSGKVKMFANGTVIDSMQVGGDFSNWSDSMYLALGNEFDSERPWLGTYNLVAIYNRALSRSEIYHNFAYGLNQPVLDSPSDLAAEENDIGDVKISWIDNSSQESGFSIERKVEGMEIYESIGSVGENFGSYIDSTVQENVVYNYRVKAFNSFVESDYSNEVSLKTEIKPVNTPASFAAEFFDLPKRVQLTWEDRAFNEEGYVVERKVRSDESYSVLDTLTLDEVVFVDTTVNWETTYSYRIYAFSKYLQSDYSPSIEVNTPVSVDDEEIITDYKISQNYPNPFNPATKINFEVPEESSVSIEIFNSLGEKVANLVNDEFSSGRYTIVFEGKNLSSGIYLYRISAKSLVSKREFYKISKMMLVK